MRTLCARDLGRGGTVGAAESCRASAQTWPQRTVRVILPIGPGSATDLTARLFAERLAARWGQPVVVENRPGADGIPAVTSFIAARDEHTLFFSFGGPVTTNLVTREKLPYEVADLVPIASASESFLAIAAHGDIASLDDLVQARPRRARQDQLGRDAGPAVFHLRRIPQERRPRHDARRVSRLRAGPAGRHRRAHSGDLGLAAACARARAQRQGEASRHHHGRALAARARGADRQGGRLPGPPDRQLPGLLRLARHAGRACATASPPTSWRSARDPEIAQRLIPIGQMLKLGSAGRARRHGRVAARARSPPSPRRSTSSRRSSFCTARVNPPR